MQLCPTYNKAVILRVTVDETLQFRAHKGHVPLQSRHALNYI